MLTAGTVDKIHELRSSGLSVGQIANRLQIAKSTVSVKLGVKRSPEETDWTEERIAELRKLDSLGLPSSKIAKIMGLSRNQIIGKRHRLKLTGNRPVHQAKPPFWTPSREERAERLARAGYSAEEIRKEIGAHSRQQVLEKIARLGLNRNDRVQQCNIEARLARAVRKVELAPVPSSPPPSGGKPILDLSSNECHWPLGGLYDRPERFCAAETKDGCPYCPKHREEAYRPTPRQMLEKAA